MHTLLTFLTVLVGSAALAATGSGERFPRDLRSCGLRIERSYGLARTVGLARLAERRRAWLLQEFFGPDRLFRSAGFHAIVANMYLNREDLANLRYDDQRRGLDLFDARLGLQPARRYHEAVVQQFPSAAAEVLWADMVATFEGTFLVDSIATVAAAGRATTELGQRLERTSLSLAEFLYCCRQMRFILTDADLTAEILALLQETLPLYTPVAVREHHARLLRFAGENRAAKTVSAAARERELRFLERLRPEFSVNFEALLEESIVVDPDAPYPRYRSIADEIENHRTVSSAEPWQRIFQQLGREAAERVQWLITPALWKEVQHWAGTAALPGPRSRAVAPELITLQNISLGLQIVPLLRDRLELQAEDLATLRDDVRVLAAAGRAIFEALVPEDGLALFHQMRASVVGTNTLYLGLQAREKQVEQWRKALQRAATALAAASAAGDAALLEQARSAVRRLPNTP